MKKVFKFYSMVIFNNKTIMSRMILIFGILILLTFMLSFMFGSSDHELYRMGPDFMYRELYENMLEDYEGEDISGYNRMDLYYYQYHKAEYKFYLREHTTERDYYKITLWGEDAKVYNPANRIMIWHFFSSVVLLSFAAAIPLACGRDKEKYKNLIVLGNKLNEVYFIETIIQYVALLLMSAAFTIIGSFVGFDSHRILIVQYNNGNAIAISCYIYFLIKQALAFISACTVLAISSFISSVIRNKLVSTVLSLSLFIVPFILCYMLTYESGVAVSNGAVEVYPIINLFWTEWVIGNYNLILIAFVYVMVSVLLIWCRYRMQKME